jgi:hypothetical protein
MKQCIIIEREGSFITWKQTRIGWPTYSQTVYNKLSLKNLFQHAIRAHRYSLGLHLKILEMTPPLTLILFGVTITLVLFTKGVVLFWLNLFLKKSFLAN